MKILIINHYSSLNKGDAAILDGMLCILRKELENPQITVLSHNPDTAKEHGVPVFENIAVTRPSEFAQKHFREGSIFRKIAGLYEIWKSVSISILWACAYKLKLKALCRLLPERRRNTLESYADADIIVSCGGGFLHDSFGGLFLTHLYCIFFGKFILNKPTVIFAQSIGPFKSKLYKSLTKAVLEKLDLILLREEISYDLMEELPLKNKNYHLAADAAFLAPICSEERIKEIYEHENINTDNKLVGVSVRLWNFPNSKNPEQLLQKYKRAVAASCDNLIKKYNVHVVFVSMVSGKGKFDSDSAVAKDIAEMMESKDSVTIIPNTYNSKEIKGIISKFDLFVGTRMHSNIFATSSFVPTYAIAYLYKTEGIMKMIGQERWVCKIEDANEEQLPLDVEKLWNNREKARKSLKKHITTLEEKILLNTDKIKQLLTENQTPADKSQKTAE